MLISKQRLSIKITGILLGFFVVATVAIGLTLLVSWQLEGGAAAINDAGSQRMRSYRIGYLLARNLADEAELVAEEMERFDAVLGDLERGDPYRPLAPARDADVMREVQAVRGHWQDDIRPQLSRYLAAPQEERSAIAAHYAREVGAFVAGINKLVLQMERTYAFNTNVLRLLQIALVGLAMLGTLVLIRFFFVLVVRPVDTLYDGIRRMARDDLSVRLPVESSDEFGALATGFNQMADHIQKAHATLEERVAEKTGSLAARNQELAMLYEITAFLNAPTDIDTLCRGFLQRVRQALGAMAGAVRLNANARGALYLQVYEGLPADFIAAEAALDCDQCLCGDALQSGQAVAVMLHTRPRPQKMTLNNCIKAGFATASVFPISHNKQTLGVFNLYFSIPREFSVQEKHLLETLGQHLGVAIENLRLQSREKELAVFEERNLLAQELHDSIAQGLAFLNIQTQLLKDSLNRARVDEAQEIGRQIQAGVQESYDNVRELLVHFRTRVHHADLGTAIEVAVERFRQQSGLPVSLRWRGVGAPLPAEAQMQVLHIVQESLSNIRKHARASEIEIDIEQGQDGLHLRVSDDGRGFEADMALSERHVGLQIMKERATRIGGKCVVESRAGQGTSVLLQLPRPVQEEPQHA